MAGVVVAVAADVELAVQKGRRWLQHALGLATLAGALHQVGCGSSNSEMESC